MGIRRKRAYGYKICYRENNKKRYVRYFITYTLKEAISYRQFVIEYPTYSRIDNHLLKNVVWKIKPITREEVRQGIWLECPF